MSDEEKAITIGFLYGIKSDFLSKDEVSHRVQGFRHAKGFKEAKQLMESHNQQIALEARKDQLDKLIDINSATFNRWTQKDISHFFEEVGRQYRELETELATLKSKKEKV